MQGSFSPMGGFTPGGGMGPAMGSRPAPSMGMGGMFGGGAQQISPDQLSALLGRGGRNPDGSPHTGDEAFFGPNVGGGGVQSFGGPSQPMATNLQGALASLFGGAQTKPAQVQRPSGGTPLSSLLGNSRFR